MRAVNIRPPGEVGVWPAGKDVVIAVAGDEGGSAATPYRTPPLMAELLQVVT